MKTTTRPEITEALTGFTLTASAPVGKVIDGWPCIAYDCTLTFNGRPVWSGPYHLGVGHVKLPHQASNPAVNAEIAAKLAKVQKVAPQLPDVMHSLLMDGEPFYNAASFKDWATEFGYDVDSRKAEAIYRECMETSRQMIAGLGYDKVEQLRAAFSDY